MSKRNKFLAIILAFAFPFACVGCSGGDTPSEESSGVITYEQISGAEAKALMENETGYIIIDARTQSEYDQGHIPGAILIPEYEIASRAKNELPDKNQLILVYCRSGRRSKIAAAELVKLGYTNVKEFGGIIDWEYEIVK
jgi:rhodanese-related sulfurtransferase